MQNSVCFFCSRPLAIADRTAISVQKIRATACNYNRFCRRLIYRIVFICFVLDIKGRSVSLDSDKNYCRISFIA